MMQFCSSGIIFLCATLSVAQDVIQTTDTPCTEGWIKRPGSHNCYFWDDSNLQNFYSATTECNLKDADLLVINDQAEQNWVNSVSSNVKKHPTDGWFIGLQKTNSRWSWIRGKGVDQPNWNHEPDNNGGNQTCISIDQYGRSWDDTCNLQYGYICQYTASPGTTCPVDTGKVKRRFSLGTTCYYVSDPLDSKDRYSWSNAQTKCKNINPTATLLTLKSLYEMAFIDTILPAKSPNIRIRWWMGLTQKSGTKTYVWQDGSQANMTLIKWDSAPSTDPSTHEDCAIMYSGGEIDDAKCSRRAFYICEKSSDKEYLNLGCGPWLRAGIKCYLFSDGRSFNRSIARSKCQSAGGDLLKVDNVDENYWINQRVLGPYGYWTGLTDAAQEGTWLWADGTLANITKYVRWNREPNNYASNEDCGMIYPDGVYNDIKCSAEEGYICEYNRGSATTACVGDFIGHGASCYYISDGNTTDFVRWLDVPSKCNDLVQPYGLTATYIAIDSKDEKSWLESQIIKQAKYSRGWWTGLNDRVREGLWAFSGEGKLPDPALLNWNSEPNNAGGNENCAIMYEGGRYNDLPCSNKAFFICERALAAGYGTSASQGMKFRTNSQLLHTVTLQLLIIFFLLRS